MRSFVLLSAILLLMVAFIGCSGESSSEEGATHGEEAVETATEAVEETAETVIQTKDEYVATAEATLEEVAGNIAEWKNSINDLPAPAKAAAGGSMEALVGAHSTATEAVGKIKSAGDEDWEQYKPAADQAMGELGGAVDKVKALF